MSVACVENSEAVSRLTWEVYSNWKRMPSLTTRVECGVGNRGASAALMQFRFSSSSLHTHVNSPEFLTIFWWQTPQSFYFLCLLFPPLTNYLLFTLQDSTTVFMYRLFFPLWSHSTLCIQAYLQICNYWYVCTTKLCATGGQKLCLVQVISVAWKSDRDTLE